MKPPHRTWPEQLEFLFDLVVLLLIGLALILINSTHHTLGKSRLAQPVSARSHRP